MPTTLKNKIEFGDCRDIMRRWAADGVQAQTCVTSPPYFGLRDYGIMPTTWPEVAYATLGGSVIVPPMDCCLGLEPTPEAFIGHLVLVFRSVRDVLADDGTLWLNIGDSYARTGGTDRKVSASAQVGSTRNTLEQMSDRTSKASALGLKDKDLIGIPWMLACALRADGWYLRQEIIWHKSNPMPESVTDRCTKAHEQIFLLTKRPRYYFDSEAMREPAVKGAAGSTFNTGKTAEHQLGRSSDRERTEDGKRNRRSVWTVATHPYKGAHFATFPPALIEACRGAAVVISAVTADSAVEAAHQAAPHLRPGQLYVDLNSVSPTTKAHIAKALAPSGCDFVEFAVMAPVAQPGIAVPILAGGGRAGEIAGLLNPLGMAITAVSADIGVASATKLCRSIVIKGMEALMVDLGLVGEKTGVLPAVLASLTASYPGMDWAKVLEVMPGRVRQHGVRRAAEMREVARMLEENGLDGGLAEAIARRHETFADPKPEDLTKPADPPKTEAPAATAPSSIRSTADVA